ncbi:MAG: translation initiation factor IF-2 N-terminal domain-containing protein, partial [Bacillota bacterium]|nr:translation initiation factor IF-2 N-terminal domain-containing protein [Bacillota bacterium]
MSEIKVKVHELAKELDMEGKELVSKARALGYDVKASTSTLSEMEAKAIRNTILHSRKKAETKIVKVKPKEQEVKQETEEARVVKQAAVILKAQERSTAKSKAGTSRSVPGEGPAAARTGIKPPEGVPLPKSGVKPPEGVPLPKSGV